MPDPITDPGSNPGVVPPVVPPAPNDAAFARLRTEAAAAQQRADAAEAKIKDIERGQMDEKTRLETELVEAKNKLTHADQLTTEHGKYVNAVKSECDATLATIADEEKRKTIAGIVEHVPLDQRLGAIRNACMAIGVGPAVVGTHTQPSNNLPPSPNPAEPPKPLEVGDIEKMSFSAAMKLSPSMQNAPNQGASDIAEMRKELANVSKQLAQFTGSKT